MGTRPELPPLSRRHFFARGGANLASIAWLSLLGKETAAETDIPTQRSRGPFDPLAPRPPHFTPRAKSVIFLYMVGGPSQLDLFDPKPELIARSGEPLPDSLLKVAKFAQIQDKQPNLMGSPWKFSQHGHCGAQVSELLPHTARIVDRLAVVRTLKTDDVNHAFAELQMNTGWRSFGRPSMGAWTTYGLGSEADNLPGFAVLQSGMWPRSKSGNYGSGFLPSVYQGIALRSSGAPILNMESPVGFSPVLQQTTVKAVNRLNGERLALTGDPEIASRMAAYETAFRMQTSAPELSDLSAETRNTLKMYGIGDPAEPSFARNCLFARRLVERGVRFVQVFHGDWDHHTNIERGLPEMCRQTDRPSAALVQDLALRGLLDETLVIWGGEFGRSSVAQTASNAAAGRRPIAPARGYPAGFQAAGRDHHIEAFTMWFAGGGIKAGQVLGSTDDFGYFAADDAFHVHDLQATILHLLGLDHTRLTYRFQGRDFRLTDVHGTVIDKLLA